MSKLIDLTGRKFGSLTAMKRVDNIGVHVVYECNCQCGTIKNVRSCSLLRGDTTSCGCFRSQSLRKSKTTHGHYNTPTYRSYRAMIARCTDKSHKQYNDYAGRGITVCERWSSFEAFLSDMGERPQGKTLDRENNDKGYSPDNCKWSTVKEQNNNKRKPK